MGNGKEKKEVVITAQTVLKIVAIIAIVAMVVSAIIDVARGTPFLEVFTDQPLMWFGAVLPAFVIFVLPGLLDDEKKKKESESKKDEE